MFKRYYAPAHQVFTQVMKQRRDDIKKDHGESVFMILDSGNKLLRQAQPLACWFRERPEISYGTV